MGEMNVRQLFGGKAGNRGKGRPKGSVNRRSAGDRAREAREAAAAAREDALADMRAMVERERLRQELDDLRRPARNRERRAPAPRNSQDALVQAFSPLIQALAPAAAEWAMGQARGKPATQQQQPPAALPPAPTPPPVQQQQAAPAPTPTTADRTPTGRLRDSMEGKFLRSICESKGPQGLAAWLVTADDERAQIIVQHLCTLPDEQLPQLWASVVQGSPGLAAFCAWLQAWPHYGEAVQAVRMLRAQQQQQTVGTAAPPA